MSDGISQEQFDKLKQEVEKLKQELEKQKEELKKQFGRSSFAPLGKIQIYVRRPYEQWRF